MEKLLKKKINEAVDFMFTFLTGSRKLHRLKTWPNSFRDVKRGVKNFELRKDDRDFTVGDIISLEEWEEATGYKGDSVEKRIIYILRGIQAEEFGLKRGFCILGLEEL